MAFFSKKEKDPVCGMQVDPKKAAATQEHEGRTYYFCSPSCKASFVKNPGEYLSARSGGTGGSTPGGMGGAHMGH